MKTKTKKISLLAISTIALAMPFAASAGATVKAPNGSATLYDDNADGTLFSKSPSSFSGNIIVDTSATTLGDGYSIGSAFSHLAGTGVVNTYFTVANNVTSFVGTWGALGGGSLGAVTLYDISKSATVGYTLVGDQYNASLIGGDTYDWKAAYSNGSSNFSLNSSIQVSAVPELEQWAGMLIGLLLVGAKVTRAKKSASSFNLSIA